MIDLDGNGVITKDELTRVFQKAPPAQVKDVRIWAVALFDELDSDGSGEIQFTQWQAAALRSTTQISDAVMQAAFRTMDVDNTGGISSENLSRILQVSGAELNSIMTSADLDGDGVINFEDFKAIFTRLAPSVLSGASSSASPFRPERKDGSQAPDPASPHSDAPSFSSSALPWTDSADDRQTGPASGRDLPNLGLAPWLLDF